MNKKEPFERIECKSREDWLRVRTLGIGGSDASAIAGVNPWKSNVELLLEKQDKSLQEDISQKPAVKYGTEAEDALRKLARLELGEEYQIVHFENQILRNKSRPWQQASLDGEIYMKDGRRGILEIKTSTPTRGKWDEWDEKIPDNYFAQILHYFLVTNYDFAILFAFLRTPYSGNAKVGTFRRYEFYRNSNEVKESMEYLLAEEERFMKALKNRGELPIKLPNI